MKIPLKHAEGTEVLFLENFVQIFELKVQSLIQRSNGCFEPHCRATRAALTFIFNIMMYKARVSSCARNVI